MNIMKNLRLFRTLTATAAGLLLLFTFTGLFARYQNGMDINAAYAQASNIVPDRNTNETGAVQNDTAEAKLFQKTFTQLRGKFKNPILDDDFKTLKALTNTSVYLDFLRQAHPTEKPFETLADFLKVASPPEDRYRDFLNQHFENVNDADVQGIHLLTRLYLKIDMLMMHAEQTRDRKALRDVIKAKTSIFIKKGPISNWINHRLSGVNEEKWVAFYLQVERFATETRKSDTAWIQAQFEAHGQEDGLLWIALQKPILTGEILSSFPKTDLFLQWVEQTDIVKKLTALDQL